MSQKRTFWGKIKRAMGKPWPKDVRKRLDRFENKASKLDFRVEVRSTAFVRTFFQAVNCALLRGRLLGLTFDGRRQAYNLRRLVRVF